MRLLVAFPACRKQYDAAVVRYASCRVPRREQAAACEHCHSDFTLSERAGAGLASLRDQRS